METVKADDQRRVQIPGVKAGQVFAIESDGRGKIVLIELEMTESKPVKARLINEGGHLVATTGEPLNMDVIRELLAEFP